MKKEKFEQYLINSITDYVVGAISNDFVEEEMLGVKEGVYIAPAADKEEPWHKQGCEITWKDCETTRKDSEGNPVKKSYLILDWLANDFGDLVLNGRHYVEVIAREIYRELFEENMA